MENERQIICPYCQSLLNYGDLVYVTSIDMDIYACENCIRDYVYDKDNTDDIIKALDEYDRICLS